MDSATIVSALIILFFSAVAFFIGFRLGRTGGALEEIKNLDLDALSRWAGVFVKAAEKMFPGEQGLQKLAWVIGQIKSLPDFLNLDDEQVRTVVEAAVFDVKGEFVMGEVEARVSGDPLLELRT